MSYREEQVRERAAFLSREPEQLRQTRGRELYDTLEGLGLTHSHFYRALGTSCEEYCAREFGIDLRLVTVERFFQSDATAKWLFPDIVREAVLTGMRRRPVYRDLIARDERVSGAAVDIPYVCESEEGEELRHVAEGAAIPESAIAYGDRIVRLDKRGRGVLASYEVVRRMSVDMLRVHLMRIGERLGRDLDARLVDVLVHGDSSSSDTSPVSLNTAEAGEWAYEDLLKGYFTLSLDHAFTPTHVLADGELTQLLVQLPPFKEAALFGFSKTGELPTPLGLKLIPMTAHPEHRLTILDAGHAAVKLTEQDLMVENDKLINQQWDRTYLTVVTDFAVLYEKARVVVRSDWE